MLLQALGQEILDEPVPEHLRGILREMLLADLSAISCAVVSDTSNRGLETAAAVFAFYSKSSGPR